nr:BsuPI-related putative proteinase inhibitor [Neobacillus sp. Marseille-Q6967]
MINKKWMFAVGSILIIGLLTGCGAGANTNGGSEQVTKENRQPEEVKFQPFIEIKEENNAVIVNYKVKNVSGDSQKLTFMTGLQADFIVYDQEGKKVKQYSDEVSSTQAITEVVLENNEELENGFTIPDLYNGQFKIEVFLTAKEEEARVVKDFKVEKSLYSKGNGEYIGQMDPHTIEVKIKDEAVAFQLTEEAIQQLSSIKEGDKISFIFSETDIQKTIEKFILDSN